MTSEKPTITNFRRYEQSDLESFDTHSATTLLTAFSTVHCPHYAPKGDLLGLRPVSGVLADGRDFRMFRALGEDTVVIMGIETPQP